MSVTFNFNVPEIMGHIEAANQEALVAMGRDIIADSNKYCPFDHGILKASVEPNSDLENGIIVWNTPYAQYLYYGVLMVGANGSSWAKAGEKKHVKAPEQMLKFSKDHEADTQMMWFHKAKDIHVDQWIKEYQKNFEKTMKGGG